MIDSFHRGRWILVEEPQTFVMSFMLSDLVSKCTWFYLVLMEVVRRQYLPAGLTQAGKLVLKFGRVSQPDHFPLHRLIEKVNRKS